MADCFTSVIKALKRYL